MNDFDLHRAINAISDIVQNRPPPLREFDQIYMKVADMVVQAEYVARVFNKMEAIFIGDGDSIALSCLHLKSEGVINYGPKHIEVLDFDERIVRAIERFSEKNEFQEKIHARLYNVADSLPTELVGSKDAFYMNPPWGASNGGESVCAFLERGISAVKPRAHGLLVIADDPDIEWTQTVLRESQARTIQSGFLVSEMTPRQHAYHLDDAPGLRSCSCLFFRSGTIAPQQRNEPLDRERRLNFYGKDNPLRLRYVREVPSLNYGRAMEQTYQLEPFKE